MNKYYLIKLYPEEPFFFGGEKSFGSGDAQSYFIRSSFFPQQTAVLGMLRYQMLKENNKLGSNDPGLIGTESFSAEETGQSFGKIKSISPVFIQGSEGSTKPIKRFIPLSFDYCYDEHGEILPVVPQNKTELGKTYQSNKKAFITHLSNYDAKLGLAKVLIESGGSEIRKYYFEGDLQSNDQQGLFIKETRIGIYKSKRNIEDEEEAFYRQEYLNLLKGFCFAFFAELEFPLKDDLVKLGKEQSIFRMVIEESEDNLFDHYFTESTFLWKQTERMQQLILTSDAFVSTSILENCDFAITEAVDFRNIITPSKVKNYGALDTSGYRIPDFMSKSSKYNLFKRGSVFYGDPQKLGKFISNTQFSSIGYNYYKPFNSL